MPFVGNGRPWELARIESSTSRTRADAPGVARGVVGSHIFLSGFGVTFATRERAEALSGMMPEGDVTVDFTGVRVSSSFLDGLIGAFSVRRDPLIMIGLTDEMSRRATRIVERREAGAWVRVLSI